MLHAIRGSKLLLLLAVLLLATTSSAAPKRCQSVGGTVLTNMNGYGPNNTLGVSTGDIRGAVGVEMLSMAPQPDGTVVLTVQHHWVTESGDVIYVDQGKAIGRFVAPNLFAMTEYQVHVSGGTGRYDGVTGDITTIGEGDFNTGYLGGRYSGTLCKAAGEDW